MSEELHLAGVQSESRGEYVCTAQNGVGLPLTKTIRITVNSKLFLVNKTEKRERDRYMRPNKFYSEEQCVVREATILETRHSGKRVKVMYFLANFKENLDGTKVGKFKPLTL